MELRPLAYYRRNSEEYQRERNRGHQNSAFSHFSHRDQIVNSSVTPIHENNIQTVFQQGTYTVFENHRKSLIQHCERSELRSHFNWSPDRSILAGQILVENAKFK